MHAGFRPLVLTSETTSRVNTYVRVKDYFAKPMTTLKFHQQAALDALRAFARTAQPKGPALVFGEQVGRPCNPDPFETVSRICLRILADGGKTLMAVHAVKLLAPPWRATEAPMAVWLVPSDTICSQTLKALKITGHPYREPMKASYGAGVGVCVLEDQANIAPPDRGQRTVVVVATIQSFRIDDTDKRNFYSFSENFGRYFKGCDDKRLRVLRDVPDSLVTAVVAKNDKTAVLPGLIGQPRWSFANWPALREPLLIVDEAHNTKTDKCFTALKSINASAKLELTATPISSKTNMLCHVSAQELAESTIKLPIALAEHPQGWQQAVFAAVQTQRALKDEATSHGYVCPIVLFPAQNENDEAPLEALRKHLEDELHIPKEQIKVATSDTRKLEGLDLALRDCPVRFAITVQAGSRYSGRYQFSKHFYPVQADQKDGDEEFLCAQMVANHAKLNHGVPNLTTAPCGFALAKPKGRFFPDFVAEFLYRRNAFIEYKGAHLLSNLHEIKKRHIGKLWARKSAGKCLYAQIVKDRARIGMSRQLQMLMT